MPCIELDSALSFISNLYINKISYNSISRNMNTNQSLLVEVKHIQVTK